MAALMNTFLFPDSTLTITKNIKMFTMAAFKMWVDEYKALIQQEKVDLKINKRMYYEGPGAAAEKPESDASTQSRMYEGNIETATQKTYAIEFPITWEQIKYVDKNANFMQQIGQFNARSQKLTKEYDVANILNLGFSGGPTGYDGQQYFSASHTWRSDGSTYDNLLAAVDLGRDAVEDAFIEMAQSNIEFSIPNQSIPRVIHIAYSNIFELPELLKSIKDPDNMNNTHNVIRDYNLTLLISQPTTFDSYMDNPTKNLIERSLSAHSTMFYRQLGTFGSQGG
jgi:hypothetical protein